MSLGTGFRNLASLLDTLESHGITVASADVAEVPAGNQITATIEVEIPTSDSLDVHQDSLDKAANGDAYGEQPDATPPQSPEQPTDEDTQSDSPSEAESEPDTAPDAGETETDATGEASEAVSCTVPDCDETFETERGMKIHRSHMHGLSDDGPSDREDEQHETEQDGTEQRKNQADEEANVETATDEDTGDVETEPDADEAEGSESVPESDADESEIPADMTARANDPDALAELSLDVSLPDGMTPADIYEAVRNANTVYEVQRDLDLGEEETMSLLSELDLLELVHGRVATKHRRERAKDEIGVRLLRHAESEGASA